MNLTLPLHCAARNAGAIAFALGLAACASTAPVPVMEQLGPDSYMVTVPSDPDAGGHPAARALAEQEAESHCGALGRVMLPTHMSSGISAYLEGGATELNFRCLAPDDPLVALPPAS